MTWASQCFRHLLRCTLQGKTSTFSNYEENKYRAYKRVQILVICICLRDHLKNKSGQALRWNSSLALEFSGFSYAINKLADLANDSPKVFARIKHR